MKTVVRYTRLVPNGTSLPSTIEREVVCDKVYFEVRGPGATAEFLVTEENGRASYVPTNWIHGDIRIRAIP